MAKYPSTILPQSNDPKEIQRALLDLLDKINKASQAPTGVVLPFAGSTAPDGYLLCDGGSYLRTKYASLFAVIGAAFGAADGDHFNVPDMREAAPVGAGTRAAGATAHDAFALGEFKDDQMQGHGHDLNAYNNSGDYNGTIGNSLANSNGSALIYKNIAPNGKLRAGSVGNPATDGVNGTPRAGTVTRGKGLGLNFIIKT